MSQDYVGIGTLVPEAGLHVYGSSVLFDRAEPEPNVEGAVPVSGEGTRFMWVPNKPALRVGTINAYVPTGWDASSVGNNSYAIGQNAVVEGYSSAAIGNSVFIPELSEFSTSVTNAFAIGCGRNGWMPNFYSTEQWEPLLNDHAFSFMVGFNDIGPALTVKGGSHEDGEPPHGSFVSFWEPGKVGVNTKNPTSSLQVVGNACIGFAPSTLAPTEGLVVAGNAGIGIHNPGSKLQVSENAAIGYMVPTAGPISGLAVSGSIGVGIHNPGSKLQVNGNAAIGYGSATSAPSNRLLVSGNVGIGVLSPAAKLHVCGMVLCREVKVEPGIGWCDDVFADDYPLRPLTELRQHIRRHRHLPGVPSADQIAVEGWELAQMQTVLLEKLEELYLYVFQLEDQLKHCQR